MPVHLAKGDICWVHVGVLILALFPLFPHFFVGWNPTAAQAMKTQRTTLRRIRTMTSSRRVSFQTAFLWRMKATSLFTFRCLVKQWNVNYCSIHTDCRSVITLLRYLIQVLCCDATTVLMGCMWNRSSAHTFVLPGVSCIRVSQSGIRAVLTVGRWRTEKQPRGGWIGSSIKTFPPILSSNSCKST